MIDPKQLLEQMLGGDAAGGLRNAGQVARDALNRASGAEGFAGGAIAGGLLGLLLGGGRRQMGGGLLGYGGAAVLGALAYRAYQNWQQGRDPATTAQGPAAAAPVESRSLPAAAPAADGRPFELSVLRAMIAAAKADGHIDADEQRKIFAEVERRGLDAEAKAFVFDSMAKPIDLADIAGAAQTQEQAAELYLAAGLVIDPDEPAERAYLAALASRLNLPAGLVAHLDRQIDAASSPA